MQPKEAAVVVMGIQIRTRPVVKATRRKEEFEGRMNWKVLAVSKEFAVREKLTELILFPRIEMLAINF